MSNQCRRCCASPDRDPADEGTAAFISAGGAGPKDTESRLRGAFGLATGSEPGAGVFAACAGRLPVGVAFGCVAFCFGGAEPAFLLIGPPTNRGFGVAGRGAADATPGFA